MNIDRIRSVIETKSARKADIIRLSGVSKATLDNVLKGMDPKVSTIEAIASALGVHPAIFFDDCESSCEQKPDERVAELQAEVARLKDELLSAQAKIIKLLGDE